MLLNNINPTVKKVLFCTFSLFTCLTSVSQQVVLKSQTTLGGNSNSNKNSKVVLVSAVPPSNLVKTNSQTNTSILEKESEIVVVSKIAPSGVEVNYLPLFGGYNKTEAQQIEDEMFLSDCDKNFENREKASAFFAKMGWEYLEEGNKNNAVHRFNLAWLLMQNNPDTYWGLGVVEYQSSNFTNAITLMTKSLELHKEPNHILMVDLATIYIQMSLSNPTSLFESSKAKQLLQKAISTQPNYVTSYMQLALVNLLENNPESAWEAFHKGYELSPSEVNQEILKELLNRKADPKGIFKP
jgi:tetratricopeptide (TPR) repeat protein